MPKRILVGTDGSDTAAEAVRRAADLARDTGAELIVFTAYAGRGEASAQKILEPLVRQMKGVKVRTLAREGRAADAILDAADEEGVDLIVVGNKGLTGARRFFLGSVPSSVSQAASRNLLIVKTS